jgi:hypothetical protein
VAVDAGFPALIGSPRMSAGAVSSEERLDAEHPARRHANPPASAHPICVELSFMFRALTTF